MKSILLTSLAATLSSAAIAQFPAAPPANPGSAASSDHAQFPATHRDGRVFRLPSPPNNSVRGFLADIFQDEKSILVSPAHFRIKDLRFILPLAGGIGFLLATDQRNMSERFKTDPGIRALSSNLSNLGTGSMALIPATVYWWGWRHGDEYAMDSSLLTARALADSLLLAEGVKLATWRERPMAGNGAGRFYSSGPSSSFPSLHSTTVWSIASVLAHRYPGWLSQFGLYGLASAVSLSRVSAREHFPSDVLAGGALGWVIGRYVSRTGSEAHPLQVQSANALASSRQVSPTVNQGNDAIGDVRRGSPFVPMDSWIYGALDRLADAGFIPSQTSGLRPWARAECLRQLAEADSEFAAHNDGHDSARFSQARSILSTLHREFDTDSVGLSQIIIDSVYTRSGFITGRPLNDSFHFGQTWSNDFGRPYGQGWNSIEGLNVRAESGRFFAEVQGEVQHAPGQAAYPPQLSGLISRLDDTPLRTAQPLAATNRFRTIEAYVGIRVGDFELSVGKQALYWGPTYDAPLSFSDNAEPTKNGKISMIHPVRLPGPLRHVGAIRGEFVIGKLGGQQYTWRPWFNAQKLSFKVTENLEFGFTRWSIFWGVGHPITVGSFLDNLGSVTSPLGTAGVGRNDPGDRKAGFDFRYRVPGLRNWLTLYSDSYSDDDPSPLAAPRRAAMDPGLVLTHVPGLPRLDFRIEVASTTPYAEDHGGQFIYYNNQYRSGNTNYGYLLGNSVGRDARAVQGWSRYWLSPRSKVEFGYRQNKVGNRFLPGGGTQTDASLKGSFQFAKSCFADVAFQYERYWLPTLGGPTRNLSGSVQLRWEPKLSLLH